MVTMILTIIIVGIAAIWDMKTYRIPNFITFPAMALGLIINTYYAGWSGLGASLAGTLVGVALLVLPFALGGMGAGDVKLLAAVGAINGSQLTVQSFICSAITGGVIAVIILIYKGQLKKALFNIYYVWCNFTEYIFKRGKREPLMPFTTNIRFPYGTAIFIGTFAALMVR